MWGRAICLIFFLFVEQIFFDIIFNMVHFLSFDNCSKISHILEGKSGEGRWSEFPDGLIISWGKHGITLTLLDS